jgi:hypothetical protein
LLLVLPVGPLACAMLVCPCQLPFCPLPVPFAFGQSLFPRLLETHAELGFLSLSPCSCVFWGVILLHSTCRNAPVKSGCPRSVGLTLILLGFRVEVPVRVGQELSPKSLKLDRCETAHTGFLDDATITCLTFPFHSTRVAIYDQMRQNIS